MSPNQSAKSEVIGSLVKTTAEVAHRGNDDSKMRVPFKKVVVTL